MEEDVVLASGLQCEVNVHARNVLFLTGGHREDDSVGRTSTIGSGSFKLKMAYMCDLFSFSVANGLAFVRFL